MQAKPGVIEFLNTILTNELTAINQYFVHGEMCQNWGYKRLYQKLRELSISEMKDAEELVEHILYLDGVPNLQRLGQVMVGESVAEQLQLTLQQEQAGVDKLREAIAHCDAQGDFTTRGKLEEMIREEEEHIDWLEMQIETIGQVGLENYLSQQIHDD
jgi:bacterioferritin